MATIDFRERLLDCLGGRWPELSSPDLQPRESVQCDGYRRDLVSYRVDGDERVSAYLLIPNSASTNNPAPGIAVWHQHNGAWDVGKVEPAGVSGNPMHHTGVALAQKGYVVICPDAACFGERQDSTLPGGQFERFEFLRYVVQGKSLAWKNILDMRRAIDILASLPEVNADKLGCYGHSMGSTHTYLVGPWDQRLKCLVCNCCLPTYAAIHRKHLLHCFPNFIPGLLQYGDTPDIVSLIAPRPLLMNFGETDIGSPIEEVRTAIESISRAYEAIHAEDNFQAVIEAGIGHVLSETMWQRTWQWFEKHLGTPAR